MAVGTGLKKQITSINSTSKITQAMKLVATAKLKKIGKQISNSKPYFSEVYTVFNDIISKADDSIYQKKDGTKASERTCWIVINSNLGLCGGYNININKLVLRQLRKNDCIIVIGSKAELFYANKGCKIMHVRKDIDIDFSYDDAREFAQEILSGFNGNTYDEIKIAYTKFINNVTFKPTILQLLPIVKANQNQEPKHINIITEFEPDPATILENAVPMYLNTILFSTIIESQVSEQASRRLAMENAMENAHVMLEKLSLLYNRKRQAAITQEITEIVAGAGAQEN
ncbi:ATP synthase F1 subunit gamma [Spiroplasma endosymbiont of Polydrusus cervinus]|uniref:ATP synthase F1 subunit gamma n=1 Tax=Spiroplasma endosymbiont of Polydrusus cervinus TaxID=3066287 RepID=UPI0030CF0334